MTPRSARGARLGAALVLAVLVPAVLLAGAPAPAAPVTSTTATRSTAPTTTHPPATVPASTSPTTTPITTAVPSSTVPSTTAPHRRPRTTTTTTTPAPAPTLAAPGLSLAAQPAWIQTQGNELIAVRLGQPSVAAQPGAGIQLTIRRSVTSRTDFENALSGKSLPDVVTHFSYPFSSNRPTPQHEYVLTFGLSGSSAPRAVGIDSPGVYPVEVGLYGTKVTHSTFVTWMVVIDPQEASASQPLRVSWIWQIGADPFQLPVGVNPSTLAAMQPGGRLDHIATLLARAGSFPLTLGIGPETLAAWSAEARTHAALAPGFERVRSGTARPTNQRLPEPYVPIAAPTLIDEGLGSHLPEEFAAGSKAVFDSTGRIPDPRAAFVDPADTATLDQLTQMQVSQFVVRDTALVPVPEELTPAQPFTVATSLGTPMPAAATNSPLEALFNTPGSAALREQRVIAALAEIAYEAPSVPRGVVIATPNNWSPDVATVSLLLHDLARDPLVQPATLNTLFSEVPAAESNGAPVQRQLAPLPSSTPHPLTAKQFNDAARDLAAYTTMVGPNDTSIAGSKHSLLLSLSTVNTRSQAQAYLNGISAKLHRLTSGITTTAKTLTLTARRAYLPLSFQNDTGRAGIRVLVHLDSPKLIFPKGTDFLLELPIGHSTAARNQFPVEARASGTFAMTISLESPDGKIKFGPPTRVTIRSAVFSGIGIALTLSALLFLAFWWGNHFFRTRRARRRARAS